MAKKDAYLTAKIDRLFKTVFVNPDNTKFMNAILSEVLEQEVKVLKFYPTELPVRNKKERVKVLDVLLKTKDGKYTHVKLTQYDKTYQITKIDGDRVVLAANRNGKLVTWAVMNIKDIKKV